MKKYPGGKTPLVFHLILRAFNNEKLGPEGRKGERGRKGGGGGRGGETLQGTAGDLRTAPQRF